MPEPLQEAIPCPGCKDPEACILQIAHAATTIVLIEKALDKMTPAKRELETPRAEQLQEDAFVHCAQQMDTEHGCTLRNKTICNWILNTVETM